MDSNFLYGLVGVILGAAISGLVSWKIAIRNEKFLRQDKLRERIANGLVLSVALLDSFHNFRPLLIVQTQIGLQINEDHKKKILKAIETYDAAKSLQYLLPKELRIRWDEMLTLISEYQNLSSENSIVKNRATCDVQNYILYVRNSLIDVLDSKSLRNDQTRPYLNREDVKNWEENIATAY
jgi:hypothetical protein